MENNMGIEKKSWYFFRYQERIIDDELLCAYDKATYGAICKFADTDTGLCHPSLNTLKKKAGCSKKRLIKSIKNLIEAGYIFKKQRKDKTKGNKSNIYKVKDLSYISNAIKHAENKDNKKIINELEQRLQQHPIPNYDEVNRIIYQKNNASGREPQGVVGESHKGGGEEPQGVVGESHKPSGREPHELELKNYNHLNKNIKKNKVRAGARVREENSNNPTDNQEPINKSSLSESKTKSSKSSKTDKQVVTILDYFNKKLGDIYKVDNYVDKENLILHRIKEINVNTNLKGEQTLKEVIDLVTLAIKDKMALGDADGVLNGDITPTPDYIFANQKTIMKFHKLYNQKCNVKEQDFYSDIAQLYFNKFSSHITGNKVGQEIFDVVKKAFRKGMSGKTIIFALNQTSKSDHPNYFKTILSSMLKSKITNLSSAKEFVKSNNKINNCDYPKINCLAENCPNAKDCPINKIVSRHLENTDLDMTALDLDTKQMIDERLKHRSVDELLETNDKFLNSWEFKTAGHKSLKTVYKTNQRVDKYLNLKKSYNQDNKNETIEEARAKAEEEGYDFVWNAE